MDSKVRSLLSLCQKAGFLVTGEETSEKALRSKKAKLVIVSEDASENTKKKFSQKSFYYKVPYVEYGNREELGACLGKGGRVTLVLTDAGFADKLLKMLT